tara:strand:+ start:217 stop:2124 length:1908 start_codon:yes stop_codon:yes gene_type:complete
MATGAIIPGQTLVVELQELFKRVKNGEFALPEFQRPKVWEWKQERELLVSLIEDVPIGSFLLWEYNSKVKSHRKTIPHKFDYDDFTSVKKPWGHVKFLVIDGQQRLGYLASILSKIGKNPDENSVVSIFRGTGAKASVFFEKFVEDKHLDEKTKQLKDNKTMAFVDQLVDLNNGTVINDLKNKKYREMASNLRSKFNNSMVPIYTLPKTDSRSKALFVYQRVNSSGKTLKDEDYAEAALGYVWNELSEKIREAIAVDIEPYFGLENKLSRNIFVKCLLDEIYGSVLIKDARKDGLDIFNPRIIEVHAAKATKTKKAVSEISDPLTDTIVEEAFNSVKRSFIELRKMLVDDWKLTDSKYLLTNELLFGSAFIRNKKLKPSSKLDSKDRGKISKWMILSMVKKPTSGGSTQKMAKQACIAMRGSDPWGEISAALTNSNNVPLKPFLEEDDLGKLDDKSSSIVGGSSMLWALVRLHNIRNGCVDIVDETNLSDLNLQLDHFYAKTKIQNRILKKGPVGYFDHIWDHAANKIWLNGGTNNWKNAKWPTKIGQGHIHTGSTSAAGSGKSKEAVRKNLKKQALPNREYHTKNNNQKKLLFDDDTMGKSKVRKRYQDFLKWRRKNLVELLNATLDGMFKNGI